VNDDMSKNRLTLIFGGDIGVGENAPAYFEGVGTMLEEADVRMAQLEVPYISEAADVAGPDRTTAVLEPLKGRFDLLTLSGNHFYDLGERGVRDTVEWCRRSGIACCGGGSTVGEASAPGFVVKDGVTFGVLAFNAVGPKSSFAGENKGGTAFVDFIRGYIPVSQLDQKGTRIENDVWELKKPLHLDEDVLAFNFVDERACDDLAARTAAAKKQCDILIVYFHKGYVHRPVTVGAYERLISHIAIDNGADAVMASHAHLLRGVELYKNKAIYHGLNNFIMWAPHLSPLYKGKVLDTENSRNEEWIKARVERFGFVPDPDYPTYPFHPESVYCMAAKLIIEDKSIVSYRLVPMKVEKTGIPYVHGSTETGREIVDYLRDITLKAGLNTRYDWEGSDVVISD
jgi:poly-gamma-glutamate synthesis protein (capsule biosynthesis protein)